MSCEVALESYSQRIELGVTVTVTATVTT